jgi:hypothetical protein
MDRLPPFDELSNLRSELESDFAAGMEQRRRNRDRRIDEILDMLIVAYMFGNEAGNEMLYGPTELPNGDIKRTVDIDIDEMDDAIFRVIAGKDWQERVTEYLDDLQGTVDDIIRVVDTDMNRIYNDAVLDVGERSEGTVMKTWQTMLDDRVRDTHEYLQSETVPIDRRFYTFDGDSARYPGDFADPQNNINCRCRISLSMA